MGSGVSLFFPVVPCSLGRLGCLAGAHAGEGVGTGEWGVGSGRNGAVGRGQWGVGCGDWGVGNATLFVLVVCGEPAPAPCTRTSGEWGLGTGEWGIGNGEWGVGSGKWGVGVGTGEWGLGSGGNGEWGVGNGEWGVGTGAWGTNFVCFGPVRVRTAFCGPCVAQEQDNQTSSKSSVNDKTNRRGKCGKQQLAATAAKTTLREREAARNSTQTTKRAARAA